MIPMSVKPYCKTKGLHACASHYVTNELSKIPEPDTLAVRITFLNRLRHYELQACILHLDCLRFGNSWL